MEEAVTAPNLKWAAIALLGHVAASPGGAEMLAAPSRMQHLAAAAQWILTSKGPSAGCAITMVKLLQQVAGVATAAGRVVPWLPLIAALLQQQLLMLDAAKHVLQLRQVLQQMLEVAGEGDEPLVTASLVGDGGWSEGPAVSAAAATGALPVDLGAAAGEERFDLAAYICSAEEAAATAHAGVGVGGDVDGEDTGSAQDPAAADEPLGESSDADELPPLLDDIDDDAMPDLIDGEGWLDVITVAERIIALLECLMPLATSQQGLLALAPHVQLLQAAAAALPVEVPGLQASEQQQQQLACRLWAKKTAAAVLAALKQEHRQAYDQLCCEIRSAAAECSAAAQAATQQEQQQPPTRAVVSTERLAAASAEVTRLEHLLQLAGLSLNG
jgi:hypothetical protein